MACDDDKDDDDEQAAVAAVPAAAVAAIVGVTVDLSVVRKQSGGGKRREKEANEKKTRAGPGSLTPPAIMTEDQLKLPTCSSVKQSAAEMVAVDMAKAKQHRADPA